MKKKEEKRQSAISFSTNISKNEFVNRKKELIIKDYESLFTVYGRETSIIYNFRSWAVILLTAYFTYVFTSKLSQTNFIYLPGLFIIAAFYFLEVSERSVMRYLLKELRALEKIFMIDNTEKFELAIISYEFRDLKDERKTFNKKISDFLISTLNIQTIFWNLFLITIYFILIYFYTINVNDVFPKS